ncbi:divergent polysaccharide deacetylase family protein [Thermodesulfobacteriota bacterium]
MSGIAHSLPFEPPSRIVPVAPRITLIIDDIGFSRKLARRLINLDIPLTFAVLPHLQHSRVLAHEAHERGREIMLHQPMEPCRPDCNPGPGALYVGFAPQKITEIMAANIEAVPHVMGVNNHMGSRFTASPREVNDTLRYVKARGLLFVDSVTTSHSQAFKTARKLRMTAASRNIFIDHQRDEAVILEQLGKLERHARRHGCAIGIGHPYPETVRTLTRFLGEHRDPAIEWVPVSSACC